MRRTPNDNLEDRLATDTPAIAHGFHPATMSWFHADDGTAQPEWSYPCGIHNETRKMRKLEFTHTNRK